MMSTPFPDLSKISSEGLTKPCLDTALGLVHSGEQDGVMTEITLKKSSVEKQSAGELNIEVCPVAVDAGSKQCCSLR